jgi:hypothetical protein
MKRRILEQHVAQTTSKLELRAEALKKNGVAEDAFRRDPAWRSLDADRRAAKTRLVALSKVEQRDAEVEARRAAADSESEEAGDE